MASSLPSPEPSSRSMSLLDLDSDESHELAYSQEPADRNGSGAIQHGVWPSPWGQEPEYGRRNLHATPGKRLSHQGRPDLFSLPRHMTPPPLHPPVVRTQGLTEQPWIPERQLDQCYSYALDSGHGTYTRLIPADCLPPSYGLEETQSREGLIILPRPRGLPPRSRQASREVTGSRYGVRPTLIGDEYSRLPQIPSAAMAQGTIDQIVASHSQNPTSSNSPAQGGNTSQKQRRGKIYCDKWIHDGNCAFTQQGCKYLHEMPLDMETQMSVGLFNGLPAWYKRMKAVELKQSFNRQGGPVGVGSSWRGRGEAYPVTPPNLAPRSRRAISTNRYDIL